MGNWHRQQRGGFLDPILAAPLNVRGPWPMVAKARTHLPSPRRVCSGSKLPLPHFLLSVLIFTSPGLPGCAAFLPSDSQPSHLYGSGVPQAPPAFLCLPQSPATCPCSVWLLQRLSSRQRTDPSRAGIPVKCYVKTQKMRVPVPARPHVCCENLGMHFSLSGPWFSHHFFLISHSKVKWLK